MWLANMASSSATLASSAASDLLRSSTGGFTGVPLRTLGRTGLVLKRRDLTVSVTAKLRKVKKKEYPWSGNLDPNVKGGVLTHLSPFKPLKEKPKPVILDFEKPLLDLEKKISDVTFLIFSVVSVCGYICFVYLSENELGIRIYFSRLR